MKLKRLVRYEKTQQRIMRRLSGRIARIHGDSMTAPRKVYVSAALLSIASFVTPPAGPGHATAIIIRHDRDDARHVALAAQFPAAGTVAPDGICTLIAPDWVITAAHVAQELSPFSRAVTIGGTAHTVERVILHPSWTGRPGDNSIDVALMRLAAPVEGVAPVELHATDDEPGRTAIFVGNGNHGDGRTGPRGFDGQWRAATNIVAEAPGNWLRFSFDAPPDGTELEGISGPGDSGGPALLERDGRVHIIGVGSYNQSRGVGECRYGSQEFYARISTAREWIEQTMRNPPPSDLVFHEVIKLSAAGWPDTRGGEIARGFFEAYGGDEGMERFENEHRAASALADRTAAERAARWREIRESRGRLTPQKYVHSGDRDLVVLVRAERDAPWISMRFRLEDQPPHKLVGIGIGPDAPPVDPDAKAPLP